MPRFRIVIATGFVLAASLAMLAFSQGVRATQYENENENANANQNANTNTNANANANSNTNASVTATNWRGTLTALSGTTLPATLSLQIGGTLYTVNVTSATVLDRKYNGTSTLDEFAIGDTLRVWGTLNGTTIDPTTRVKNYSIQRVGGTFKGVIRSIDASARSFVLDLPARDDQTVLVVSTTKVFQGNRAGTFADLAVGQSVKVIGVWRRSQDQVRADRILIKLTELNGTLATVSCDISTLTMNVKKGRATQTWTLGLTASTVLRDKDMDPVTCAELAANHKVHVRGLRTGSAALNVLLLVDKGLQRKAYLWKGEVTSLSQDAKTFILDQKKGTDPLVMATSETIIVNEQGVAITFADLVAGHEVQVRGTITGTTITANLILDKDLP